MALVYCCSLDGQTASIILICTSCGIKASAKFLNVNLTFQPTNFLTKENNLCSFSKRKMGHPSTETAL